MLSRRGLLGGATLALYRDAGYRDAGYRDAGGAAIGVIGVYAPTPVLIRQLAAGGPADLLLTADRDWMNEAVRQGLVQPATRINLMSNDLVLAAPAGRPIDGTITPAFPLQTLLAGGRLAMCDPDHDPAGRYAKQSLEALGFWQSVEQHIAIAESAPAAVVLLNKGEVGAAICFRTDLYGDQHAVSVGTFPPASHAPILYPIALARDAHSPIALDVLAFLHAPDAVRIFSSFGYTPAF